ncbi:MAG: hypothetical protein OXM54_00915 [Acidimicrobiaceae bacterium]|nr:hypothetical protein [Acidimicrobiaceae bacterium]
MVRPVVVCAGWEAAVSEEIRSRLYAWLCEQTAEPEAEYLMSCLAPAPLSDLVTKDFLSAEVARLDGKVVRLDGRVVALAAKVDQLAAQRAEDRAEHAAQRAEDRAEHAAQRAEDQRAAQHRHWWLVGTVVSAAFTIGVQVWLGALGVIG